MKIAIVGASGAVGQELIQILEERNFPLTELTLFGSERSAGKNYSFKRKEYTVKELKHDDSFKDIDIAFVSAGSSISEKYAQTITKHGAIMIDNSSAFRMDKEVPLVVPEVNAADALHTPKNIIANPNCTTIQLVVSLAPIEKIAHIKKVHVSTYQSASGAGASAIKELLDQTEQIVKKQKVTPSKFPYQLAFNLIPQVDDFTENAYTKEEMKMYNETRKIMHSTLRVSANCVRVPVERAHSQSIWIETEKELSIEQVKDVFSNGSGITIIDNPTNREYPMPIFVSGKDNVYIGRIRKDLSNPLGITFWSVSDQLRKGAALNAIQIAEYLIKKKGTVKP